MARTRTISPDFWTMEAVIDCRPMTRLLFIGLWNFADDGGVQKLRPRTIRMQVFPGDTIENDGIRAMIEELAAHGLVRIYAVDGVEYVAIVDWTQMQRVGKHARLRYPSPREGQGPRTAPREKVPSVSEVDEGLPASTSSADDSKPPQSPSSALRAPSPRRRGEKEEWQEAIDARLKEAWPDGPTIDSMDPAETERWIDRWIAEGCDLERDVLVAVRAELAPPAGLQALALAVDVNRSNRLAAATPA